MLRNCHEGAILARRFAAGDIEAITNLRMDRQNDIVQYRDTQTQNVYGRTNFGRIVRTNPNKSRPYFLNEARTEFVRGRWLDGERVDKNAPFQQGELLIPAFDDFAGSRRMGAAIAVGGFLLTGGLAAPLAIGAAVGTVGRYVLRPAMEREIRSSLREPVYLEEGVVREPPRPAPQRRDPSPERSRNPFDDEYHQRREYMRNEGSLFRDPYA